MSLKCAFCSAVIDGEYVIFNKKNYHRSCYMKNVAPRCGHCGQALVGAFVTFNNKSYHKECYDNFVAPHCYLCRKVLGKNFMQDFWGNSYHSEHKRDHPSCEYCGRFIASHTTKGGRSYPDGRRICSLCYATAVSRPVEGDRLLKEAKGLLKRKGLVIPYDPAFRMVDARRLAAVSGRKERSSGELGHTLFQGRMTGNKMTSFSAEIFILSGLPEVLFLSTAAHEWMHVWFLLHARGGKIPPPLLEGSCNYGSYLLLSALKNKEADFYIHNMMESKNPVYGAGFRKVYKEAGRLGFTRWLQRFTGDGKSG